MDEMQEMSNTLSNIDIWKEKEKEFLKKIKCYLVKRKQNKFHAICDADYILNAYKKHGVHFILFLGNPLTFLNGKNNILIPYGFWTCKCTENFVQTPYSTFCEKCSCNIQDNTKRAKYFEDFIRK